MESKKVIVRTIKRLKEIKEEQSLSVSQIMDKMCEKGYVVSESTLKRIFAPGSEKMSFRYQESIAPVAEVLFAEYGDTGAADEAEELRKIIIDRDKTIENLMCTERRTLLESHIKSLQDEVELLRDQIDKKDRMFERIMSHLVLREGE